VPSLWTKYRGAAVLVSSPAKYGVDVVAGTWTHPLGVSFGIAKKRPIVRGDAIVACPTFTLTLSFDRRVMAGAQAARLFRRIVDRLEKAESEMVTETGIENLNVFLETSPPPAPHVGALDRITSVESADPESCNS
jgi:hypothetical protein